MTFFGLMHGEHVGIAQTPLVAVSYLIVAGILLGCAKLALNPGDLPSPAPTEVTEPSPA
jgi:AGZA family xanthine/uracil permease-like MFS transporter